MKRVLILVAFFCVFSSLAFGAIGTFSSRLSADNEQTESHESSLSLRKTAYQDMYATFTMNAMAHPLALSQSRLQVVRAGIYDKMAAFTLRVRGNAGETLMSHFYVAEGWSQIPGQTGNQGIDGLFVRRGSNGGIIEFQVVDSKVGSSMLQKTKNGWQLSPEWTRNNLMKCLRAAEKAYAKSPSSKLAGLIDDYKKMLLMMDKGYVPPARIYHAAIRVNAQSGRVELVMENSRVDFARDRSSYTTKPSGRAMRIDMQTPDAQMPKRMLKARNKWYGTIEENLTKSGVPRWLRKHIVSSLKENIQNGTVSSSKAANKFMRDKIVAYQKAVNYSKVGGIVLVAGVFQGASVVVHDWIIGSVDSTTWKNAGVSVAGGSVAAAGMTAAQTGLTKVIAKQVATYQVKHSTKAATQKLVALAAKKGASNAVKKKLANKIASETAKLLKSGKIGGGVAAGVGGVFGVYEIGSSYYKLQRGEISTQDALVYGSLGGANVAGAVATCLWGGPVAWIVGGVTCAIGCGYSLYQGRVLARRMALEEYDRALFNTEWLRQRFQKKLRELEVGSINDEKMGWKAIGIPDDARRTDNKEEVRDINGLSLKIKTAFKDAQWVKLNSHKIYIDGFQEGCGKLLPIINIMNEYYDLDQAMLVEDIVVGIIESDRKGVLITETDFYFIESGKKWVKIPLKDIKSVDWERRTNGNIFINDNALSFLVDYRKPFVDLFRMALGLKKGKSYQDKGYEW